MFTLSILLLLKFIDGTEPVLFIEFVYSVAFVLASLTFPKLLNPVVKPLIYVAGDNAVKLAIDAVDTFIAARFVTVVESKLIGVFVEFVIFVTSKVATFERLPMLLSA